MLLCTLFMWRCAYCGSIPEDGSNWVAETCRSNLNNNKLINEKLIPNRLQWLITCKDFRLPEDGSNWVAETCRSNLNNNKSINEKLIPNRLQWLVTCKDFRLPEDGSNWVAETCRSNLNNNKLINEKLICAFRWSVLPSIIRILGPDSAGSGYGRPHSACADGN